MFQRRPQKSLGDELFKTFLFYVLFFEINFVVVNKDQVEFLMSCKLDTTWLMIMHFIIVSMIKTKQKNPSVQNEME